MARARLGDGQGAVRLLQMMNPIEHTRTPADVERYRGEPYVAAADVYSAANFIGRAGWTWYTGSAAWMYRIWVEEVLGFHLRGDELSIQPVIPPEWPGFELSYRYRSTPYEIQVVNNAASPGIEVDGARLTGDRIRLLDDQQPHRVIVNIAARTRNW